MTPVAYIRSYRVQAARQMLADSRMPITEIGYACGLGNASYFGKIVHKPWIGDAGRSVEDEDIRRVCRLLYLTAFLGEALCLGVLLLLFRIFRSVF